MDLGVRWATEAARAALDTATGSPYLIQYVGDETWLQAPRHERTTITHDQVEHALAQVRDNLDKGMVDAPVRGRLRFTMPGFEPDASHHR